MKIAKVSDLGLSLLNGISLNASRYAALAAQARGEALAVEENPTEKPPASRAARRRAEKEQIKAEKLAKTARKREADASRRNSFK